MIYNWITKVSTTERIPWTLWGSCVLIAESCRPLSCLKKNLNPLNLTSSFDKTKAHILWLSMSYYGKLESRVQYTRIAVRGPSNHIINRSIHIQQIPLRKCAKVFDELTHSSEDIFHLIALILKSGVIFI